jgi:hypothetical protein
MVSWPVQVIRNVKLCCKGKMVYLTYGVKNLYSDITSVATITLTTTKSPALTLLNSCFRLFLLSVLCRRVRKISTASVSVVISVCLFAGCRWFFMKFDIWKFFGNLSRKFKFNWNLKRITGTLPEHLLTFMVLSCWIWVVALTKKILLDSSNEKCFRQNCGEKKMCLAL